jgi:hypothetical protein
MKTTLNSSAVLRELANIEPAKVETKAIERGYLYLAALGLALAVTVAILYKFNLVPNL